MEKLKFKTNIKCGGCIAKVTPSLNGEKNILKWQVDTNSTDKVLVVESENLNSQDIINLLAKAGFEAQPLTN